MLTEEAADAVKEGEAAGNFRSFSWVQVGFNPGTELLLLNNLFPRELTITQPVNSIPLLALRLLTQEGLKCLVKLLGSLTCTAEMWCNWRIE
jgi:hypothetical protein